jgi:hypothetical protein
MESKRRQDSEIRTQHSLPGCKVQVHQILSFDRTLHFLGSYGQSILKHFCCTFLSTWAVLFSSQQFYNRPISMLKVETEKTTRCNASRILDLIITVNSWHRVETRRRALTSSARTRRRRLWWWWQASASSLLKNFLRQAVRVVGTSAAVSFVVGPSSVQSIPILETFLSI